MTLTTHPLLAPWSRKGRAIPVSTFWACFTCTFFPKGSSSSPCYFHVFFLIVFFEEALIRNRIIILFINYVIIIYVGQSNSSWNSRTEEMIEKVRQLIQCDRRMTQRGDGTRSLHLSRIHSCDSARRFEDKTCQCDNAPSHTSLVVRQFLANKSITVVTQITVLSISRPK
jgi:hypothetical protein